MDTMTSFTVPTRERVSENNKTIFDQLTGKIGFMPNLYAVFAFNDTALSDYLALQNRKTTLTPKEKEVVYLVVSQINDCKYCVPAHTVVSKKIGFTEEQIISIRKADISFDYKLNALAQFVKDITINKGRPGQESLEAFFDAGYNEANLVDVIMTIGDKIIANYLHNITQVPVDWPAVPAL